MKIIKKKTQTIKIKSKDSNLPSMSRFVGPEKNDKNSKKTIETKPLSKFIPRKN